MAIDSRGGVSIGELIAYTPATILSIIVCSRHGFKRSSGWLYTLFLCIVRITGAICQLVSENNPSEGLIRATLIIDSIGLSPLLLATLGMISRLVDWINAQSTPTFNVKYFRLVQLLIILALILSIVGGTSGSTSSNGGVQPPTTSKVGIILFIIAFVAMGFILSISCGNLNLVPSRERRIAAAVGVASPFIVVRLIYSALAVFLHTETFSIAGGSVRVRVGMAVVEEFLVVLDYLILGCTLKKLASHQQGELASHLGNGKRNRNHVASYPQEDTSHSYNETGYAPVDGEEEIPFNTTKRV